MVYFALKITCHHMISVFFSTCFLLLRYFYILTFAFLLNYIILWFYELDNLCFSKLDFNECLRLYVHLWYIKDYYKLMNFHMKSFSFILRQPANLIQTKYLFYFSKISYFSFFHFSWDLLSFQQALLPESLKDLDDFIYNSG